jgi:hypothetical protein
LNAETALRSAVEHWAGLLYTGRFARAKLAAFFDKRAFFIEVFNYGRSDSSAWWLEGTVEFDRLA